MFVCLTFDLFLVMFPEAITLVRNVIITDIIEDWSFESKSHVVINCSSPLSTVLIQTVKGFKIGLGIVYIFVN